MKRYRTPGLVVLALMAAFWAYVVIDNLIREFSRQITYVDLVVIFVLAVCRRGIAGCALPDRTLSIYINKSLWRRALPPWPGFFFSCGARGSIAGL